MLKRLISKFCLLTSLLALLAAGALAPSPAFAAGGAPISAFNGDGKILINPSSDEDKPFGIAIDTTAIYIAGSDAVPGNDQWRLEKRDLSTGALIPAFGTGGIVTENPSTGSDVAYDIAIDATGIYVVGADSVPGNSQWRIEKRDLTNGNLLWPQTNNPGGNEDDIARGVAVDSTGIYVVGVRGGWVWNNDWYMEKRDLTTGDPIWTQTSNPSGDNTDEANDVAIDSTGIYVVGFGASGPISAPSNPQWRIEKRNLINGNVIWNREDVISFGGQVAYGVAIDSTGIYVVGYIFAMGPGNNVWHIEKRNFTGNVIWGVTASTPNIAVARDVAVDSTGVYVIGTDRSPGNSQWRIEKRELGVYDCGLRAFDGTSPVTIICEDPSISPLRIYKGPRTYGISVVDPTDPNASPILIRARMPLGIKALRKQ